MPEGNNRPPEARILIVDDEQVIREIIADFLSLEGFFVRSAKDGSDALVELSRSSYDLVLCDLKMPNLGGLELLEAIRNHSPQVVTIIMTGFGTVESAIKAMKRGAYDYILKPFKVEEVVRTVRRGLEKKNLEAENLRLRETLSLFKVSEAIAASLSLEEIVSTLIDTALREVDAHRVEVFLQNGYGQLERRAHESSLPPGVLIAGETLNLDKVKERLEDRRFILVRDSEGCAELLLDRGPRLPQSAIVTELYTRQRRFGLVAVWNYDASRPFDEGQRKLLTMVSDRAAAAIENARLYENLKDTFHQTIRGLAAAIDKMDRYTAGHSERVAAYAQILAIKLRLDEATVEVVRQSALMHDVGKVGCVMSLNKPGKLSQEQYDIFKLHPGYGRDILAPISFLHPLIPGVLMHHERWDGHGYPLGIKKNEIPLIARIISIADTYDAMTSDRAYRKALPHEVALAEIERCSGSQFDPEIAHNFLDAIHEEKHRQSDSPTAQVASRISSA